MVRPCCASAIIDADICIIINIFDCHIQHTFLKSLITLYSVSSSKAKA